MQQEANQMRKRATAIIIKDGAILLIKRIKPEREYFIFPGGGVDEGETIEDALRREVKEELCLDVKKCRFLFEIENLSVPPFITIHAGCRNEYCFLIEDYGGIPKIGGPEKERMTPENQYHVAWLTMEEFATRPNIFPREAVEKIIAMFGKKFLDP